MWSIFIDVFFLRRQKNKEQNGQGLLEYILVLSVVLGIVLIFLRPFFTDLRAKVEEGFTKGIFSKDANFYYFPVRRTEK